MKFVSDNQKIQRRQVNAKERSQNQKSKKNNKGFPLKKPKQPSL